MHDLKAMAVDRTPYIDGPDGARLCAQRERGHASTLAPDDPARTALQFSAACWDAQAAREATPELQPDSIEDALAATRLRIDRVWDETTVAIRYEDWAIAAGNSRLLVELYEDLWALTEHRADVDPWAVRS